MNSYKEQEVLITGGLGFIGSNLAIKMVEEGAKVTIADCQMDGTGWNYKNIEPVKKDVELKVCNINSPDMVPLVKKANYIFNLAGVLSHIDALNDPIHDLHVNTEDHLKLLLMCLDNNRDARIVYTGTRNQYGRILKNPVTEEHPFNPIDPNGISEIAAEMYHHLYYKMYGIRSVSLRLCNVFGPRHQMRHPRQGVLNWFIRQVIEGEEISLMGGGDQIRDCIYVDDLVDALGLLGGRDDVWGEAYNIGCYPVSLRDFVEKLIAVNGEGRFKDIPFPSDRKTIEIGSYVADYSKLTGLTGWKPRWELGEALKSTLDYYRQSKDHYF